MNKISDRNLRVSQLTDGPGTKDWRYTKDNVVGIYGVASEERKDPNKKYKSDPCLWLKIKWKGLRPKDTENMQRHCSWIPKSDFIRFCNGKRSAEARSKRSETNKKNAISMCSGATLEETLKVGLPPLAHWGQQRGNHLSESIHSVSIHLQFNSYLRANMKFPLAPLRIRIGDSVKLKLEFSVLSRLCSVVISCNCQRGSRERRRSSDRNLLNKRPYHLAV